MQEHFSINSKSTVRIITFILPCVFANCPLLQISYKQSKFYHLQYLPSEDYHFQSALYTASCNQTEPDKNHIFAQTNRPIGGPWEDNQLFPESFPAAVMRLRI